MRDDMTRAPVRRTHDGGIETLVLDRPDRLNALSVDMLDTLLAMLAEIAADGRVRAVVIAGAGRAFCAGHDLEEMHRTRDKAAHLALFEKCSAVMMAINDLPVPVIARVHGLATAAGCQLVAACDLAFAAASARFATSGVKLGLFCSTPAVALSRNVSPKRAFDMLVTGDFIDAATAADWGLVTRTVPDDALDGTIDGRLASILQKSPAALRHGKRLFRRQQALGLADAYAEAAKVMACNMMEPDAREGIDAFLGKRRPVWQTSQ